MGSWPLQPLEIHTKKDFLKGDGEPTKDTFTKLWPTANLLKDLLENGQDKDMGSMITPWVVISDTVQS